MAVEIFRPFYEEAKQAIGKRDLAGRVKQRRDERAANRYNEFVRRENAGLRQKHGAISTPLETITARTAKTYRLEIEREKT